MAARSLITERPDCFPYPPTQICISACRTLKHLNNGFDHCVMILNSQGNQILSNLSPQEYSRVIMLLEEAILATVLAN